VESRKGGEQGSGGCHRKRHCLMYCMLEMTKTIIFLGKVLNGTQNKIRKSNFSNNCLDGGC